MAKRQAELMKGTLDLLVLKTLALEPRHGVGVADRIQQISGDTFIVKPGSLFPALHRLEAGRLHQRRMEPDAGRAARQVLPDHRGRPAPARRREEKLGPDRRRRSA